VTTHLASSQVVFTAQHLDYNLFELSLDLQDVTLPALGAEDAPPFAHIARATVDMSLLPLLRGRYVVEEGAITRPTVHVVLEADRSNLPQFPEQPKEEPSEPIDYFIRQLSVSDAEVRFEDRRHQLGVRLPMPIIDVRGQMVSQDRVRLLAGGGQVRLHERQANIERVVGDVVIDRDGIRVEQLELGAAATSVTLSSSMVRFEDPRYDLTLGGDFDIEQIAVLAGLPETATGTNARLHASGRIGLQRPQRRFTNEILRPRFVYAGGVRVGLAPGLGGQELPLSERFFAGGSTTLRGFAQNAVGPIGADGIPLGGEAMLIINNELRVPPFGMVDGVVFRDVLECIGLFGDEPARIGRSRVASPHALVPRTS
jgi:Omp85 superfamily domain